MIRMATMKSRTGQPLWNIAIAFAGHMPPVRPTLTKTLVKPSPAMAPKSRRRSMTASGLSKGKKWPPRSTVTISAPGTSWRSRSFSPRKPRAGLQAEARRGANPTRCPQGLGHRLQLVPSRLAEPAVRDFLKSVIECKDKQVATDPRWFTVGEPPFAPQFFERQ
jgi:hypothetical protein